MKDDGKEISVYIPMSKTKEARDYIICGEMSKVIRDYVKLRPTNAKTDRMFMQYRKGKCVNQVMGKHSIAKIPKEVAAFLKLPEPKLYTGHSFRRTSTTIAADAGASFEDLMRLGPWKSISVCQRYIQDSKTRKRKMANLIGGANDLPSTSSVNNNGKRCHTGGTIALTPTEQVRLTTESLFGQSDETCNENAIEFCDVAMNLSQEAENSNGKTAES